MALVSKTPCAIGYSGMGYHTDDVKWLKISSKKGEPGVEPSVETCTTRRIHWPGRCTSTPSGKRQGRPASFWIGSCPPQGQQIVSDLGYVPIGPTAGSAADTESATAETPGVKASAVGDATSPAAKSQEP